MSDSSSAERPLTGPTARRKEKLKQKPQESDDDRIDDDGQDSSGVGAPPRDAASRSVATNTATGDIRYNDAVEAGIVPAS